jgi:hypothetical protein
MHIMVSTKIAVGINDSRAKGAKAKWQLTLPLVMATEMAQSEIVRRFITREMIGGRNAIQIAGDSSIRKPMTNHSKVFEKKSKNPGPPHGEPKNHFLSGDRAMNEICNEIIDIEQYAKEGKKIPHATKYRIRIDKDHYVVDVPEMTGRALLELAGKKPVERYALYQKLHGGKTLKIELDAVADFRSPGVERFMTLPLDQTEGAMAAVTTPDLRYHFELPEDDTEFLDALGLPWETVADGKNQFVIIYGYNNIPDGYNKKNVDLHVRLGSTYPDTQIDMVYFNPPLSRKDGKPIRSTSNQNFDGKTWQQWSRHRTPSNPWRIGIDNLSTHIALVGEWLVQEIKKA